MKLPQGKIRFASVFLFLILAVNFMAAQKPLTNPDGDLGPERQAWRLRTNSGAGPGPIGEAVVTGNGINYHGGPVLKGNPVPIYLIFYGNWNGTGSNTAASVSLIEHFVSTLGNSAIEHIATTYGDNHGQRERQRESGWRGHRE